VYTTHGYDIVINTILRKHYHGEQDIVVNTIHNYDIVVKTISLWTRFITTMIRWRRYHVHDIAVNSIHNYDIVVNKICSAHDKKLMFAPCACCCVLHSGALFCSQDLFVTSRPGFSSAPTHMRMIHLIGVDKWTDWLTQLQHHREQNTVYTIHYHVVVWYCSKYFIVYMIHCHDIVVNTMILWWTWHHIHDTRLR